MLPPGSAREELRPFGPDELRKKEIRATMTAAITSHALALPEDQTPSPSPMDTLTASGSPMPQNYFRSVQRRGRRHGLPRGNGTAGQL